MRRSEYILIILVLIGAVACCLGQIFIDPILTTVLHISSDGYEGIGDYLSEKGEYETAIEYYKSSLSQTSPETQYRIRDKIVACFTLKQDWVRAEIARKKYFNSYFSFTKKGVPPRQSLEDIINANIRHDKPYQALEWLRLLADYHSGEAALHYIYTLHHDSSTSITNKIRLQTALEEGYIQQVINELEKRIDVLTPDELRLLGTCYNRLGDRILAKEYYKKALILQPRFPDLYFLNTYTTDTEIVALSQTQLHTRYNEIYAADFNDDQPFVLFRSKPYNKYDIEINAVLEGIYYLAVVARSSQMCNIFSIMAIDVLNGDRTKDYFDYIIYLDNPESHPYSIPVYLNRGKNTLSLYLFNDFHIKGIGDRNIYLHKVALYGEKKTTSSL